MTKIRRGLVSRSCASKTESDLPVPVCPMRRQFWLASIEWINSPSCQPLNTGVGAPHGTLTFGFSGSFSPFR